MIAAVGRLVAAALLVTGSGAPHSSRLFRFADSRVTEASGIARGVASHGVFYVENDSGDSNRFFAVNRRTGETAAVIIVTGARNVDWEDIAVAANQQATPSVWLADIGDNDAARHTVQLYEVAEPHIDPTWRNRTMRLAVVRKWQLRYPGGPTDAESLAVSTDGTPYIVTKSFGSATVYRVPPWQSSGRVQTLRRVGRINFHSTGTANPFGLFGQVTATGAAISTNGSVFAVRTYSDVWAWRITGSIADTLRHKPVVVPLPEQPQGEGLAVLDNRVVVDSEHPHSVVYAVPLPRNLTKPPTVSLPPEGLTPLKNHSDAESTERWWWVGGGAALVAALLAVMVVAARRRR